MVYGDSSTWITYIDLGQEKRGLTALPVENTSRDRDGKGTLAMEK